MWTSLGDVIGGSIQNYAREREEAPIRAQQSRMRELQLGEAEADAAGRVAAGEADQRFSSFMGEWDGKPDSLMAAAVQSYGPTTGAERAEKIWKGLEALRGDPQKGYRDTQAVLRDTLAGMDALPENIRAEYYPTVRTGLLERGVIKPEDAPEAYDPAWWQSTRNYGQEPKEAKTREVKVRNPDGTETIQIVPDTAGQTFTSTPEDTRALNVQLAAAIKRGDMKEAGAIRQAIRQAAEAGRDPNAGPAPERPSVWVTDGVKNRFVTPTEASKLSMEGWKQPSGAMKPATGQQNRVLNFFNRAQQADKDMESVEAQIASKGLAGQAWLKMAPNFAQTSEGQLYNQAQRAFTEARLRKDSGAAIPESEFENDRVTYFAQPGDNAATLEQKRRGRAGVLASLAFESGQALSEFVGDPDEARRIIDDYKSRAERKTSADIPSVGKTITLPSGERVKVTKVYPDGTFDGDPVQ